MMMLRAVGRLGRVAAFVAALAEQVTGLEHQQRSTKAMANPRLSVLQQLQSLEFIRTTHEACEAEAESRDSLESARWHAEVARDTRALIEKIERGGQGDTRAAT